MSEKTLKTLALVLGVLVLAWIVTSFAGRSRPAGPGEGGGAMTSFLEALDPSTATAVVFTGGTGETGSVRLERAPGSATWTVDGHPVDSAQVARFLSSLEEAGTGAPVSVNPANHDRMEVDSANARSMILERAEGADTLVVGKTGPTMGTVYARLPGQPEVHVVTADLSSHARRAASAWRSRRVAALDTAAVAAVEILRDGATHRLARGDSAWALDAAGPADATTVRNLLGELANLQAQGFVEDEAGAPPSGGEPDRTVRVEGATGEVLLELRMWSPADGGSGNLEAVATEGGATQPGVRFTLPSWRADRLAPDPETLASEG